MPKGKPANGRRLRDGERLAIVAATVVNPNQRQVAKMFDVGRSTIQRLLKDEKLLKLTDQDFDSAGRIMSTMMLANSARAQEKVTDEGLSKLNPVQLAVFSKINVEAARLLREKPTAITKHESVTDLAATTLDAIKKRLDVIDVETLPSEQLNSELTQDNSGVNRDNGSPSSENV